MENVCKNYINFLKDIHMIYVKFITITFIISEKNRKHYNHTNLFNNNNNNNNEKYIANVDSKQFDETVEHIISACPILAKEQYIKRHDTMCAQLHFNVSNEMGVKLDKEYWHDHVPKSVEKGMKVSLLYYETNKGEPTEYS
jgi:hypothetical protein